MTSFKLFGLGVFDIVVMLLAAAYLTQFLILTFFAVPADNMGALSDALKDMRGLFALIVGAYVRDKVQTLLPTKGNAS